MMPRRWIALCGRRKFSIYYRVPFPGSHGPKVDLSTKENATLAAAAPELLDELVAARDAMRAARFENLFPLLDRIDKVERLIESLRPGL